MTQPTTTFTLAAALAMLALAAAPALADDTVTGTASALGPDIIMLDGQRVILLGIDAPEANQVCYEAGGSKIWHCADTSEAVLDQTVKAGPVTCTLKGPPDPFGRHGGVCTMGGKDVAGELVKQGLAVIFPHDPESKDYAADQTAAKAAKQGLWQDGVTFENPWEYRLKHNHTQLK